MNHKCKYKIGEYIITDKGKSGGYDFSVSLKLLIEHGLFEDKNGNIIEAVKASYFGKRNDEPSVTKARGIVNFSDIQGDSWAPKHQLRKKYLPDEIIVEQTLKLVRDKLRSQQFETDTSNVKTIILLDEQYPLEKECQGEKKQD